MYLGGRAESSAEVIEDHLRFEIIGHITRADTSLNLVSNQRLYAALIADWHLEQRCTLGVNAASHSLESVYPAAPLIDLRWQLEPTHQHDPQALRAVAPSAEDRDARMREFMGSICTQTLALGPAIDPLFKQVLSFDADAALLPEDVVIPGDLVMFAKPGPSAAMFWLDPPQSVMGVGESLQLRVTAAEVTDPHWTVQSLYGSDEGPGSISPAGLYTAPQLLNGTSLLVRVVAQAQGHSCAALIQVLVNHITVNPVVQICQRGQRCLLSAAARHPGPLAWSLRDDRNGGKLKAAADGTCAYQAPDQYRIPEYCVDEIIVCEEVTGNSQSAWVMTLLNPMVHSIVADDSADLPPGQLKLDVLHGGTTPVPDHKLTWQLLAGEGQIINGIYTQPAVLQHRFALLLATQREAGRVFNGCVLLALPLLAYPPDIPSGLSFMAV